jgi:putative 4-mercaptohistidine N1-methyltranferase
MKNPYETDQYLNEYLLFHFGSAKQICPFLSRPSGINFHQRIVDDCLNGWQSSAASQALDVGCGVGRMTFELSRKVSFAVGMDTSQNFIRAAKHIQKYGKHSVFIKEEGNIFSRDIVSLPRDLRGGKVRFERGDASKLRKESYDVVAAINLIDRIPKPRKFLNQLPLVVSRKGLLILGSPYTWMSSYTASSNWLGGYVAGTKPQWTSSRIVQLLKPAFRLVKKRDFPFLIREHRRKYQWGVSEVLVFIRR